MKTRLPLPSSAAPQRHPRPESRRATFSTLVRIAAALLAALGWSLVTGDPLHADEKPAVPRVQAPLTDVERVLREGVVTVVVGQVRQVQSIRQQQIVHHTVTRQLLGERVGSPVTILVPGPGPRLDKKAPSGAWFRGSDRRRHVLFLKQGLGGHAFEFHRKVEAEGPIGDEKILAIVEELRLARIVGDEQRAQETITWLLAQLDATGMWTRIHAARELRQAATSRRDLFDARRHARIKSALRSRLPRDARTWLQDLDRYLETTPRPPRPATSTSTDPAARDEPGLTALEKSWRELYREKDPSGRREQLRSLSGRRLSRQVERLYYAWRISESETRLLILTLLVEAGPKDLAAWIRRRYADAEDREIRRALVRNLGFVGSDADVAWLVARSRNPHFQRTAWLALARIRSPTALTYLEAARANLRRSSDADAAFSIQWLDHLLSSEFEKGQNSGG